MLYDYSPIVSRSKIAWPNGARLAFYIGLNIEQTEQVSVRKTNESEPSEDASL
jgi:hypothetical protein